MYDPDFHDAAQLLLAAMKRSGLPTPLSISWQDKAPHARAHLRVQVQAADFRQWMQVVDTPVYESEPVGDQSHVHVEGYLGRQPVHLVTVLAQAQVLA